MVMEPIVPTHVSQFAHMIGPTSDDIIEDMNTYADEQGFPIVGSEVGGWLGHLARISNARSVFEFGSGFGYSAYWFARALPDDGEIVLTERDPENLERAREYLSRGGYLDQVTLEQGDAIDIIERYDGPFDIVLLDNEKHRYREAFESVREKVAPGGLVVADNAMSSSQIDFDALGDIVRGHEVETNESTRGIADYLDSVTNDSTFETALLPLGNGLAVSHRQ
jgi:caffeoyl-CoA O-methyltransferase